MKYLKTFERIEFPNPQVGDYVLVHEILNYSKKYKEFVNNNIGQITYSSSFYVGIKYENIPPEISNYFNDTHRPDVRLMHKQYIVEFAKTKEELQEKLMRKKYNL